MKYCNSMLSNNNTQGLVWLGYSTNASNGLVETEYLRKIATCHSVISIQTSRTKISSGLRLKGLKVAQVYFNFHHRSLKVGLLVRFS